MENKNMSIQYLNSENLYFSFLSGAQEVIRNKRILNEINVFPVSDGDTGSNLASTMISIIEEAKIFSTVKETMNSIADAALNGARGNSGIIIAQYINGIFMSIHNDDNLTMNSFADMVKDAVPHAYQAITNPVEGTIITVIKDWADAIDRHKNDSEDFQSLLSTSMGHAEKSLHDTTMLLKVLQDSNVVDSGAKGFVYFLQGFTNFLKTGNFVTDRDLNQETISFAEYPDHNQEDIHERYCTEALISGTDIDLEDIKRQLSPLGDSLIVAGNKGKAKIHIHTNSPEMIFQSLKEMGTIIQQKADDMVRQNESAYQRKYSTALVTDSIADLPKEYMDRFQIHMLPLNLVFENTTYLDKVTMTPEIFYPLLDKAEEYPTSAQPSPREVEKFLGTVLTHYNEVIVITVSAEQSGTNSLFNKAVEKLAQAGKKITVINSKQNSLAEGLLVLRAAELIEEGKPYEEVVETIESLRANTEILVSVNTLKYMVRSGRVSKVTGFAGSLVNLKPVITNDPNGKGGIATMAFSEKSNTEKILQMMTKDHKERKIIRFSIGHANDEVRALEFSKLCQNLLGFEPEYMMNISTIVGMSAGTGAVAVAYMTERG